MDSAPIIINLSPTHTEQSNKVNYDDSLNVISLPKSSSSLIPNISKSIELINAFPHSRKAISPPCGIDCDKGNTEDIKKRENSIDNTEFEYRDDTDIKNAEDAVIEKIENSHNESIVDSTIESSSSNIKSETDTRLAQDDKSEVEPTSCNASIEGEDSEDDFIDEEKITDYQDKPRESLFREDEAVELNEPRVEIKMEYANSVITDVMARSLIKDEREVVYTEGNAKSIINVDTLSRNFIDDDRVDVNILKKKSLIPYDTGYIKVLARGAIDKPLKVHANEFSLSAVKMILLSGGEAIRVISEKEEKTKTKK